MRRLLLLGITPLLSLLLLACGDATSGDGSGQGEGKLRVIATISPVGALALEVGGDLVALRTLVGPGVDPHDYEIRGSDRRAVDDAVLILRNGLGIDDFLENAISADGNHEKQVIVTDGVRVRQLSEPSALDEDDHGEEDGQDQQDHSHDGDDPHVWHDVENAKVMVDNIASAFARADPANSETYRSNAKSYKKRLDEVDTEVRALLDQVPEQNRKIVTNHDGFGYFIARYGFEYVGAIIPNLSTATQPSAADLAKLQEAIRREKVKAIFAESSTDSKVAEQLSRDTGIRIVDDLYVDSLGGPGSGAETVDAMLLTNARKVAEALK